MSPADMLLTYVSFFPFSLIIAVFKPQQQEGLFCFVGMFVLRGIIPEIV